MFHHTVSIVVFRAGDEAGAGEVRTGGLITGFIMHCVGKTSVIDDEELYDDEYNIDDMEEKHAIPEEILCLIENQVASNGAHESSKLLSTN